MPYVLLTTGASECLATDSKVLVQSAVDKHRLAERGFDNKESVALLFSKVVIPAFMINNKQLDMNKLEV